jgi:hypothetical protein
MDRRIRSATLLACLGVLLLVAAYAPAATPTPASTIQGIVWQWVSVTNHLRGKSDRPT